MFWLCSFFIKKLFWLADQTAFWHLKVVKIIQIWWQFDKYFCSVSLENNDKTFNMLQIIYSFITWSAFYNGVNAFNGSLNDPFMIKEVLNTVSKTVKKFRPESWLWFLHFLNRATLCCLEKFQPPVEFCYYPFMPY